MRTIVIVMLMLSVAACGGHPAPSAPTTGGTPATQPTTPSSGASISGTLQSQSTSAAVSYSPYGTPLSGMTISIVGTSISVVADGSGRFTLQGVPTGDVQLRITAPGTDATVSVSQVQASQSVDVTIVVTGNTATVDAEVRSGAGQAQLEGRVEALPPATAAQTFKAAGRVVKTDGSTQFVEGGATRSFADLQIGERVHVTGTMAGDVLTAAIVTIQNTNAAIPVEVNGIVDGLTGSASAFQFTVGGRPIHGDSTTTFFGDGDKPDTFADLKNGATVEVKGEQRNDFVFASRIHINGSTPPGTNDDSASIHGTINSISGGKPTLTLLVDSTTVRTTASTEVRRRGDVQTLDALKTGQSVHVEGQRQGDGSIVARMIQIDDDPVGGDFEIAGPVGGLSGSCPAVAFTINGYKITTSGATTFSGVTCQSLKSGDKVTVKGKTQSDGSVAATDVKKS